MPEIEEEEIILGREEDIDVHPPKPHGAPVLGLVCFNVKPKIFRTKTAVEIVPGAPRLDKHMGGGTPGLTGPANRGEGHRSTAARATHKTGDEVKLNSESRVPTEMSPTDRPPGVAHDGGGDQVSNTDNTAGHQSQRTKHINTYVFSNARCGHEQSQSNQGTQTSRGSNPNTTSGESQVANIGHNMRKGWHRKGATESNEKKHQFMQANEDKLTNLSTVLSPD